MIIVSNTSPINHLILIGNIHLLPELFGQITIPQTVYSELSAPEAPNLVRTWIGTPPDCSLSVTQEMRSLICSILENVQQSFG